MCIFKHYKPSRNNIQVFERGPVTVLKLSLREEGAVRKKGGDEWEAKEKRECTNIWILDDPGAPLKLVLRSKSIITDRFPPGYSSFSLNHANGIRINT